jgi:hypothetical protein
LTVDLSLDAVVNGGIGIVILLVGLGIAFVGRARLANVVFGVGAGAWGVTFFLFDLTSTDPSLFLVSAEVIAAAAALTLACLVASCWRFPTIEKPPLLLFLLGALVYVYAVLGLRQYSPTYLATAYGAPAGDAAAWLVFLYIGVASFLCLLVFGGMLPLGRGGTPTIPGYGGSL